MTPSGLAREIELRIVRRYPDPSMWLVACRQLCEAVGINPARCISLPATLAVVTWDIAVYAEKSGGTTYERLCAATEAI